MNIIALVGRLTRDPELRRANSGTSVCQFTIAVDRAYKQPGQPEADFPRCICFGKTAESLCQYQSKGNRIGVTGRIQTGSYEKDGQTHYTTDVVADRIDFLEKKSADAQPGGYGQQQYGGYQNAPQSWYGQQGGYGYPQQSNGGYQQPQQMHQQMPQQMPQPPQGTRSYGGYQNQPQQQALDDAVGGINREELSF